MNIWKKVKKGNNMNEEKKKKKNKNKDLDTQIIVPEKIDTLTQMKRDIGKLERLTKSEVIAKRNAISANKKLEKILIAKKEIMDKYNL